MRQLWMVLMLLAAPASAMEAPAAGVPPEKTGTPERARCALQLIEIGTQLQLHALANDGVLPARLSELFRGRVEEKGSVLLCPAMAPALTDGGFYPSYAYVAPPAGRKLADSAGDLLAFDAEPVHDQGRNVLWVEPRDGGARMNVSYMEESEFQKRLGEQRRRWQEAGHKVEVIRNDLVPLEDGQELALPEKPTSLFNSIHFKVAAGLVAAILVIVAVLLLRSRSSSEE